MNRRGVTYDVGTVYSGLGWRISTRPRLDPGVVHRELEIIKNDLNCNAVRICGRDPGRLVAAASDALDQGLEVWLAPVLLGRSQEETLAYYLTVARAAAGLSRQAGDRLVFGVGGELSVFMRDIVPGRSVSERTASLISQVQAGSGQPGERLNDFLRRAAGGVRDVFSGPLTYACLIGENVDWERFDLIGVDHYRDTRIADRYADLLRPLVALGKPVVVTETGMRTYQGARDSGTLGFGVADQGSLLRHSLPLVGRFLRPRLNGDYVRDEGLQARELTDVIGTLGVAGVAGVFVATFVEPLWRYDPDPRHDLDMSALSLVKSHPGQPGRTYPDMAWEPKQAFAAVAEAFTCHFASQCPGACQCLAGAAGTTAAPPAPEAPEAPEVASQPG
jgi:hypothetical protein